MRGRRAPSNEPTESPWASAPLTTPYGHASPQLITLGQTFHVDRSIAHLDYIGEGSLHPPKNINPPINETITTMPNSHRPCSNQGQSFRTASTEIPQ